VIEILIIEDEFIVADDLTSILESSGYRVSGTADSGEDGIYMAAKLRPHIVLMDIFLKGRLNGIEAAEHIEERLRIPVIFLTGQSTVARLRSREKGMPCSFVTKPFKSDDLIACVESVAKHYGIEGE
jgi:CheY-like chemotaxis protein